MRVLAGCLATYIGTQSSSNVSMKQLLLLFLLIYLQLGLGFAKRRTAMLYIPAPVNSLFIAAVFFFNSTLGNVLKRFFLIQLLLL